MIEPSHLRLFVIRPVLQQAGMWSPAAEQLLMGTAMQESRMGAYLHQISGPAIGIFQMEPATHNSLYANYINYRPPIKANVENWVAPVLLNRAEQMAWNLGYATVMARIRYFREKEALPAADDDQGLARYWKRYYNTPLGKGTEEEFVYSLSRIRVHE